MVCSEDNDLSTQSLDHTDQLRAFIEFHLLLSARYRHVTVLKVLITVRKLEKECHLKRRLLYFCPPGKLAMCNMSFHNRSAYYNLIGVLGGFLKGTK